MIPQRTTVTLRRRADRNVVVHSREIGTWASYALGDEARGGGWLDDIQGCTAALDNTGLTARVLIAGSPCGRS